MSGDTTQHENVVFRGDMVKTKQTWRVAQHKSDTLLTMIETLPSAFFVLDTADVYANASAQAMLGAPVKVLCGDCFWHSAPHLVSSALFQAVRKTKQTRALTNVRYASPVTQCWLHVHLAPTVGGLTLQFHEESALDRREVLFPLEEELHTLVDSMPQFVWIRRSEGSIAYSNRQSTLA